MLIWNTHPSSAAEPKWTPPVREMGVDAEGKILHLRPPRGQQAKEDPGREWCFKG